MKKENKPKGIGGWLLVMIIILILNTLLFAYDIILNFNMVKHVPAMWVIVFIEALIVVLFLISLVYLFEYNKKGIEILKFAVWLPFVNILLLYLIFWLLKVEIVGETANELIYALSRNLIFAAIWFSYIKSSVRVKNTYYKK